MAEYTLVRAPEHLVFQKGLLLVKVDIELCEVGNFAALRSTQRVVIQVRNDSEQFLGLAVFRLTGLPLKLLSSKNLTTLKADASSALEA